MTLKTALSLTLIATLIILTTGCIEYTEITDTGTIDVNQKPIIIDNGINKSIEIKTTINIDYYEDGMHITGQSISYGDKLIKLDCVVDGYKDGNHVTGTITQTGSNDPYWDLYYKIDEYEEGIHYVGTMTMKGSNLDNPDSICCNLIITGYSDGYKVTGTMIGCNPNIKMIMTIHTSYGDTTVTEYITYP